MNLSRTKKKKGKKRGEKRGREESELVNEEEKVFISPQVPGITQWATLIDSIGLVGPRGGLFVDN